MVLPGVTGEQVQHIVDEYIQFYNYERIDMKYGLTPFEIRSKAAQCRVILRPGFFFVSTSVIAVQSFLGPWLFFEIM